MAAVWIWERITTTKKQVLKPGLFFSSCKMETSLRETITEFGTFCQSRWGDSKGDYKIKKESENSGITTTMIMAVLTQQYCHHLLRVHKVSDIYIGSQMPWICYTVFLKIDLPEKVKTTCPNLWNLYVPIRKTANYFQWLCSGTLRASSSQLY